MTRHTTSRPCAWADPRPHCDASQRLHTYGPIQSGIVRTSLGTDLLTAAALIFFFAALFWGQG